MKNLILKISFIQNQYFFLFFLFSALMVSPFTKAFAFGGWSGNGGDDHFETDNLWYTGEAPVSYCIKSSVNYPLPKEELKVLVSEVINDWKRFFSKYDIDKMNFQKGNTTQSFTFKDGIERSIALNFSYSENCKENELTPKEELKIYFETSNSIIDTYKSLSLENALGLSLRQEYNHNTYRNGGYIWIGNFSANRNKIKHMLLHEFGHIFGMRHDSVFVMDEDVAHDLQNLQDLEDSYFGEIESSSWKYRLLENDEIILTSTRGRKLLPKNPPPRGGRLDTRCHNDEYSPNRFLPVPILKQLDFKVLGCHKITLTLLRKIELPGTAEIKIFILKISEENSSREFQLKGSFGKALISKFDHPSPGIYTEWVTHKTLSNQRNLVWRRITLDKEDLELPVRGAFETPKTHLAAKINNQKGPMLEIFFPELNFWWILKNQHNGLFRD